MKQASTIMILFLITATMAYASPFVPPKPTPSEEPKTVKRKVLAPGTVEIPPPPAIPAPTGFQLPPLPNSPPSVGAMLPLEKKPEPEERYSVQGLVNEKVVLIDHELDDRILHVNDLSLLDNGCVVKFPKVVCGKPAKAIIAAKIANNELAEKYEALAREKGQIYQENERLKAKVKELDSAIKVLSPEAEKGKLADHYFEELQRVREALKPIDQWKEELRKVKTELAGTAGDFGALTNIVIETKSGTEYHVPGVGKFRALEGGNTMFAFVSEEDRARAEKYFGSTIRRGYAANGMVIYILDRDQISTAGNDKPTKKGDE